MKKLFCLLTFVIFSLTTNAQNVGCGDAVAQLQNYAAQVNQQYQNEYWQIIPNGRCPAFVANNFGQMVPVNPQLIQNCRLQMLGYLNQWYATQCQYVNNWYGQIVSGCSVPMSTKQKPAPVGKTGSGENVAINTDEIEELTLGIDEDKAVKIKIPTTAAGFKP